MRALPLLALALCLTGCELDDFAGRRVEEDFHNSSPMNAGGRVTVETFNGSVEIQGWEKNEVEINGTKYASNQRLLSQIKADIVANPNEVRVRINRPDFRGGNMGARLILRVPHKVQLDRISSSNGALRVSNIEGTVRLKTSNGAVRASEIDGALDISTSNGAIEARQTKSGATTLHTSNGAITLWLPSTTNAQLAASTSNGSITTEFDVMLRGEVSKRHLRGTLGTGGPMIDLSTSNGRIRVLKL